MSRRSKKLGMLTNLGYEAGKSNEPFEPQGGTSLERNAWENGYRQGKREYDQATAIINRLAALWNRSKG